MVSINNFPFYKIAFIIFVTFSAWACVEKEDDSIEPIEPIEMEDPIDTIETDALTYLALGDSYTIGQGVLPASRWPNQLSKRLEESNIIIGALNIIAQTGWTTKSLLNAIESQEPESHDLVSLLIGVNNQYQGLPFSQFQVEFDSLLTISINLANGPESVFVVSIPDYGVTPFGSGNSEEIAEELDMYNNYMAQKCISLNIPFIDITQISRGLGSSSGALADDNLHPSGSQYGKWVEVILPIVKTLLEE
jgi:lysophospholipase L1-like esterase